ncbi:MAG: hypothetical protein A2511_00245 [Deltaproteobacteria bacterium RIFOXYD12_FULL_50_9]|nr:MAG: hypothetical protein A2511_00245 [Deltaproteobacteria bacterium RIFOXYD12_FULL_50_9]
MSSSSRLDPEHDVLYFPTMSDNRFVTAVLRSAGFTCIDNYDDDGYSLARLVALGRASVGDTVCAPLAAVYGDVLEAIADFSRRKTEKDPLLAGKRRLLIFNNKGLGPCRQGQYVEVHKLLIAQAGHLGDRPGECQVLPGDSLLQFAVGRENEGFNIGLDQGALLRGFQAIILQGVTHQLYANGVLRCKNSAELKEFIAAFRAFKQRLFRLLETGNGDDPKSGRSALLALLMRVSGQPVAGLINQEVLNELRRFRRTHDCRPILEKGRLKFHIEGEVYMRVAQFEEVFRTLLEILGFERFALTYSPLWSFLDYKIAGQRLRAGEALREAVRRLSANPLGQSLGERLRQCRHQGRRCLRVGLRQMFFRHILAAPLYRAAGLALPESMSTVLKRARQIIPTLRPGGELTPYVGETLLKLQQGYDLVLNVAPEGCMVAGMGEGFSSALQQSAGQGSVQHLFSDNGEVNRAALVDAALKILGPEGFYRR